jgi:hypothetical protein
LRNLGIGSLKIVHDRESLPTYEYLLNYYWNILPVIGTAAAVVHVVRASGRHRLILEAACDRLALGAEGLGGAGWRI